MPFCRNCGSPVEGQFCPKCGTAIAAPAGPPAAAPPPPPPPPQAQPAQPYAQQGYAPPPPPPQQPYGQPGYGAPPPAPAAGGMSDNVAGLLCYILGLLTGILFLVIEPYNRNKFVRFHAFQSIFLNVAWIALWIVVSILSSILFSVMHLWLLGALFSLLYLVMGLGFFVLWIFLMIKAYQGQKFVLPIIGPLAEKQA
jgi:uncharacterized membrane protein